MTGNVSSIVESMFASDSVRNRQNTVNQKNQNSFSDYLNAALLNAQSGTLFGNNSAAAIGYPYGNLLSGSVWQAFAVRALVDGMQKNSSSAPKTSADGQQDGAAVTERMSKPDWAKIRVIRYYQPPKAQGAE